MFALCPGLFGQAICVLLNPFRKYFHFQNAEVLFVQYVLGNSLLFSGSGLGLVAQALVIQRGGSLLQFLLARSLTGLFAGENSSAISEKSHVGFKIAMSFPPN